MQYRLSKDSLGEIQIPTNVYYGPQTQRAVINFPISGLRLPSRFIRAQAAIKAAAASVHLSLNSMDISIGKAIIQASEEVMDGQWDNHFVVDVYQAGAGTSQNMNVNEVIANRALEILGIEKDRKDIVHPNDHVNKGQSTNDTIPTAMYMSTYASLEEELLPALQNLFKTLSEKAEEFADVIKSGRTHLQDAVPMRLGQEFEGYAHTILAVNKDMEQKMEFLLELGIGGNAVGTGVNTPPEFSDKMIEQLRSRTGKPWRKAVHRFAFMQNPSAVLKISGVLRDLAVHLIKISSDLRLLSSGPNTGLAEIKLPAVQPGSSIMPGKVNPVIPEMMYMVCAQVIGNDTTIQTAMMGSQLEINVMMPVIAHNILHSISILSRAIEVFTSKCIEGIEANVEQCNFWMEHSLALVTLLNPIIGYDRAAELAKQSLASGKTMKEVVLEKGIVKEAEWDKLIQKAALEG